MYLDEKKLQITLVDISPNWNISDTNFYPQETTENNLNW